MNNKLLSALVAIVMITSVCVIPVSSYDGYAAEGDPVLKDGDAYGIYLDLNDNTINKLFSDLTESEMGHDDIESFIAALTQTLDKYKDDISKFGFNMDVPVYDAIDYDVDLELGFGIKQVSSNISGYTYRISVAADGDVMVSNTIIDETHEVDLKSTIEAETSVGMELTVVTDKDDVVKSVSGRIAFHVKYKATKDVITDVEPFTKEQTTTGEHSLLMIIDTPVVDEVTPTDITLYQTGIELLSESHLRNSEPLDDLTLIERAELEEVITIFNDNTKDGKISFNSLLNIFNTLSGNGSDLTEISDYLGMISIIPIGESEWRIMNLDSLPEFLFGDSGLKLTSSEENRLANATTGAINSVIDEFENMEFEVKFLDENEAQIGDPVKVKWGQPVVKPKAVIDLENQSGKKFIGWFEDDIIIPANLSKVYGNMEVGPIFATKCTNIDDLNVALGNAESGEEFWIELENGKYDTTILENSKGVVNISVSGGSNSPVKSIIWTLSQKGGDNESKVDIGFESSMKDGAIKIDFTHSGALPGETIVTIDVSDKFTDGTVVDIFHLDENDKKQEMIEGYFVVQNGQIAVILEHCSSYLLEVNKGLTTIEPSVVPNDTPDVDNDDGINFILIGGIAVGIVAVIGLGAFFFLRRQ